jgi:hypothetical protein
MFSFETEPMVKESNHVQKYSVVNKVYQTDDLTIFKSIDGNRVPNLIHVNRLTDSIQKYGMKCNPILVNEKMEVIDGQHRLLAAKNANSSVYFIVISGSNLKDVHTLNLNQKNWSKKDFMEGYANMGITPYIKLHDFIKKNEDYNMHDCIAFCNNTSSAAATSNKTGIKIKKSGQYIFEEGTWLGKDFTLGQDWANKIRMIKPYYVGYNRSNFVGTMILLLQNKNFDFNEFMHKLRLQPTALVDCANREQYKTLIEDIYNYRNRNKINLRF